MTTEFQTVSQNKDIQNLILGMLPWIHKSGNPYYDWIFDGAHNATKILDPWMRRSTSEISVFNVRVLLNDGNIVGGYIAMAGEALKKCRKSDTIALIQNKDISKSILMERLSIVSKIFSPINNDEFYLSKMGVDSTWKGKGFGYLLLENYLKEGKELGFNKFRLDVSSQNYQALHMYKKMGFTIDYISENKEINMTYYSMKYK